MAQLGGTECGGTDVGILTGDALVNWVTRSCLAQGVPVKVRDTRAIDKVRALLGGKPGSHERGASTVVAPGARSEAPHRVNPFRVDTPGPGNAGRDGGVIQDGQDNGCLAPEIEGGPLVA
jgi:hypothetical protein